MNKFKVGDKVAVYAGFRHVGIIKAIDTSSDDESICVADEDSPSLLVWYHLKQCRRLVKKKRECQHPHITKEKLAEAWDSYPTKYTPSLNSLLFRHICKELGL